MAYCGLLISFLSDIYSSLFDSSFLIRILNVNKRYLGLAMKMNAFETFKQKEGVMSRLYYLPLSIILMGVTR